MDTTPREVRNYITRDGREPYEEWVNTLDIKARAIIRERINRLHLGNFGDCRSLKGGVYELRIHYGSGYRVYVAVLTKVFVLIIFGGPKDTQVRDIKKAKILLEEFKVRNI